jgi:hypothetical protein
MKACLIIFLFALEGCSPFTGYRPNIDMEGVDRNKYLADMRFCEQQPNGEGFSISNPIAKCMIGKGYRLSHRYH